MSLYDSLLDSGIIMPEAEMRAHILVIRHSSNESLVYATKRMMFFALGKHVTYAVNKFFANCRTNELSNERIFHTKEDICNESYFIFEAVLRTFDLKTKDNFVGFFKKALSRSLYTLFLKNYTKLESSLDSVVMRKSPVCSTEVDLESIVLESNLTELERDFCRYHLFNADELAFRMQHNLTESEYKGLSRKVKKKLEDEINRDN